MKNHSTKLAGALLVLFFYFPVVAQVTPPGFTNGVPANTNYISYPYNPPPYVPGLKLAALPPNGTNLCINLLETDPGGTYDIFAASNLISAPWNDVVQGTNGQNSFALPFLFTDTGFFRAARMDTPVVNTAGMVAYFLNNLVNTNLVSAIIAGGPAAAMAILANDTNTTDATWIPFNSIPNVLLGTNDGTYQVEFGLVGSDGQTNWISANVTLDTTPPVLVITSPTNNVVTQPIIQLQGYSPKRLSSLSYDLTNAGGLVTNQSVFVLDQFYDTNAWKFTTNTFQAFDLLLTNGLNIITIRATDLAGNQTVLTTNFTLDYTGKTNPPTVQLIWPQAGTEVCGTNFICHGWVSDPTATIFAQLVDTNGNTNVFNALVGRDGSFWLEDLPLNGGTNILNFTITDVAGNVTATNLTITQGDLGLNIDAISAGQTTVTGEINSSDYAVWVNGVQATNNGDGTWTAQIASIGIGGGTVEAKAIPNSDNGGSGLGGSDSSGNPNSPQAQGVQAWVKAPEGIYISSYLESVEIDYRRVQTNFPEYGFYDPGVIYTNLTSEKWENGIGGNASSTVYWSAFDQTNDFSYLPSSNLYAETKIYNWPATSWPQPLPSGSRIIRNDFFGTTSPPLTNGSPSLVLRHSKFANHFVYPPLVGNNPTDQKIYADAKMALATGGRAGSTKMNLWIISCTAIQTVPQWPFDDGWQASLVIPSVVYFATSTIPQNITILGKTLGSDGNLYILLPDNTNLDVTPVIAGNPDYYTFNITAQKYTLRITANNNPLSDDHVRKGAYFCVGQKIYFQAFLSPGSVTGLTNETPAWNYSADYINNHYTDYNSFCEIYEIDPNESTMNPTIAWFYNKKTQDVTASVGLYCQFQNGQSVYIARQGMLNVYTPTISNFQPKPPFYAVLFPSNSPIELQLGYDAGGPMDYIFSVNSMAPFTGRANIVQLVNASRSLANATYGGGQQQTTGGQFWLDTSNPYNDDDSLILSPAYNNAVRFLDQPGYGLNYILGAYPVNLCSISDSFKDYIVFEPDGDDSIPVTLSRVFWSWSASTSKINDVWSDPTYQVDGPSAPDGSNEFPFWEHTLYGTGTGNDQ